MANIIDSNKQLLTDQEILQKGAMNTNAPYAYDQVYKAIAKELQQPGTQFIREGNTLFIVHNQGNGEGKFRAINADTASNYVNSSWLFIKACYDIGYDVMTTEFFDPSIGHIFNMLSKNPPYPEMGFKIDKTGTGFVGVIQCGPPRQGKENKKAKIE